MRDLTAYLAATFLRFNAMLARGRAGDFSRPFAREALSTENLRAVESFRGEPVGALDKEAAVFVRDAVDPEEVMPHQFGPIPVGLQLCFGLNELTLHHDDLVAAFGGLYRPGDEAVVALKAAWERALGGLPEGEDDWARIRHASGRASDSG